MTAIIIDIITSIFQSIAFTWTISICIDKKEKNKKKLVIMTLLFLLISQLFVDKFGNYWASSAFVTHILALILTAAFYRKNIKEALTAYTIIYFIIGLYSVTFGNLIFEYTRMIVQVEYINYERIFIINIPQWIIIVIYLKYISNIKKIEQLIIYERLYGMLIIMSFLVDFVMTFHFITLGKMSQLVNDIMYIVFSITFIGVLIYFWKVHQKSEQIYKLNEALETKNSQLRKIKHDYGAQISYLYGLCLMKRFENLKKSLKDIINNNESTPTAVEVSVNDKSILSLALKPAIDRGIHVIIQENYELTSLNIAQKEIYSVIFNIVSNAVNAMNGKGIIIAKSYEYLGDVVIKIENNGPKISESNVEKIFEDGFTTKENSYNNYGYGLSIAKSLVESYNGKIHVKSNETSTEFKIIFPIRQNI